MKRLAILLTALAVPAGLTTLGCMYAAIWVDSEPLVENLTYTALASLMVTTVIGGASSIVWGEVLCER